LAHLSRSEILDLSFEALLVTVAVLQTRAGIAQLVFDARVVFLLLV
jgi:hypothetical protein